MPLRPPKWPLAWPATWAWLPRWPCQCLACHAWPSDDVLCADCRQRHPRAQLRCTGCALALPGLTAHTPRCGACLRTPPLWQHASAWTDYRYPWSLLIGQWKLGQQPGLARTLAQWMLHDRAIAQAIANADWVLPIPLSPQRLRARGYHPAAQLARALAPHHHHLHLLQRVRDTPAQRGLPRAQRLRNLRGALQVHPADAPQLAGRRVLLVDDVMTTGATLHAATAALQQAGAAHVHVLCWARTP